MHLPSVSLIINTYNHPVALNIVLESIKRQTVLPDEVIIADDGSNDETIDLIIETGRSFPVSLKHVWQEDLGYRLARAKNKAVANSSGEYLIFLDGDLITHRRFVESHLTFARQGRLLSGGRVMLSPELSERIMQEQRMPSRLSVLRKSRNRHNIVDNPLLARLLSHRSNTDLNMKGGNSSLFKSDYEKLNGYNEDFVGWGYEDSKFAVRALRSGMVKWKLRSCAVTLHLDHGENNKRQSGVRVAHNLQMLNAIRKSGSIRCQYGLAQHLPASEIEQKTDKK